MIIPNNEENRKLLEELKNGTHPKFKHNKEKSKVECKCGLEVNFLDKASYVLRLQHILVSTHN